MGVQRFYGGGLRVLCKAIITEAKSTNECQNIQNIYSHFLQEIQDFFICIAVKAWHVKYLLLNQTVRIDKT